MRLYLQFRLGCCEKLPIVQGRRNGTDRHRRLCQQCDAAQLGDERHLVFECAAFQHIRDEFSELFWEGQSMLEFVNQIDQRAVLDFIVSCFGSISESG